MTKNFTIKSATVADAAAISKLISKVVPLYITDDFLTEEAAQHFLQSVTTEAISNYLQNAYHYWLAVQENQLLGLIGIKENRHIFHLFVSPTAHRKGIASALWQQAKAQAIQHGDKGNFTVFSSAFAKPIYQKWGFQESQDCLIKNGLRSFPMTLSEKVD